MWQSLFQGDNKGAVNSSGNLAKGSRRSGADQVNTNDEQGKNLLVSSKDFIQIIMNAKLFFPRWQNLQQVDVVSKKVVLAAPRPVSPVLQEL